ncbi:sodium-dependent phosphate transport protein 2B-like [Dreissena polymorpha]|uniref:sodium-dependent phosphate transport protein 2B-like n=1 Tax=Dreissena polymorpha TaxID=45954 RepID=UPI002263AE00|nr:sodium-dependent phosphate transport protein 2B-like [Dreissena polymorpha]
MMDIKELEERSAAAAVSEEEEDPFALPELRVDYTPWSELTVCGKLRRVLLHFILKILLLLGGLYIFVCSLSFLGDAFQLLGGKVAGKAFANNEILANPVAGLMIGVLATVLLQSSSTTTSIIVSMVGSGELLTVSQAIPIVMGANIGTSVTNTIVAMGQITNKADFRRAFAGATVHDMFNWMTVLVLLPVEVIVKAAAGQGWLEWMSGKLVVAMAPEQDKTQDRNYLKVITDPFTKLIIQIDKKVINDIAHGNDVTNKSTILHKCHKCFMFEYATNPSRGDSRLSDTAVGVILLIISLVLLCACLVLIVKLLSSLLRGQIAQILRKFINADFPGHFKYFTGYLAILIGAGLTVLVQSSSIFTSSLTPLVGMGVLSLDRMYPLTLGSNIGTTATGILAAFAQDSNRIHLAVQIALCHLFFNVCGIVIFYPLPFFRPPIAAAKFLGLRTSKYRWCSILYILFSFGAFPALIFGLSIASWIALAVVLIPVALLIICVFFINLAQSRCPAALPKILNNWKFLPTPCRSLEPYDRALIFVTCNCCCCRRVGCCKSITDDQDSRRQNRHASIKETISNDVTNGHVGETDAKTVDEGHIETRL